MKIYTKTGDQGTTSLLNNTRVAKDDPRIVAYGTVDELNAHLALLRDSINDTQLAASLLEIQKVLFVIQTLLAVDYQNPCSVTLPEMQLSYVDFLEKEMDNMDAKLIKQTSFIIPGGHPLNAQCHIARCVCRRAERCVVTLQHTHPVNDIIIQYMNRLSDYLFILSRYILHKLTITENLWEK